ncbi:hypothetical protein HELRODRAFT_182503 [Helobdella robusta]|uniref:Endonuclease/exonuclease/phosphatase domain-containing protein n=1 Tax=Helobdella robusta TaxID=6412 RepID=T1FIA2_HELRO|nr:hypothetical protein HELRODRAFT_182503 [Helobdella robusta]ESN90912.1 hypothetical protein HELRODRAFT_182503 [Helobdella robusta]
MAGKGRSTKNSNSDALRCEKESTDVQCVCCGISFAVGMTEESLELLKACDNVKFVCDECLKSPSIKDQIIKTVESGKAEICDRINSLSKEIRSEIDAIKVKLEANEGKMSGLDVPGSKLCDEISNFRNEMTRSFASVVSSEVVKSVQIINDDVKKVQKTLTNVMESKEREANIVVFRLSEGTDDRNRVCKIISHLTGGVCGETNIIKLVRLGKKNDTVVRPILVKFDDVKVKELVFKNVFKMKSVGDNLSHVGLSHDLTVEQRDELKKLDGRRQTDGEKLNGGFFIQSARRRRKRENSTFSCKERVKLMNGRQGPGYELCSLIKCGSHGFHSGGDDNSNSNENFNLGLLNVRSIARNVDGIYGLICDGLDVLVLTETWHGLPGNNSVSAAMPPGYCYVDFVRQHDPGHGGLVIYFRKEFGCRKINLPSFVTFEVVAIRLVINKNQFILLGVYRPGSAQITVLFFDELVSVLEHITMLNANILLMGDFNVHIERKDDPNTIRLFEIFEVFQLVNHVNESTHLRGGTLDLVVSSVDFPIISTTVLPHGVFSDHSFITVETIIAKPCRIPTKRFVRSWKNIDEDRFVEAVLNSPLSGSCLSNDVDDELKIFNEELKSIIDRLVPKRSRSSLRDTCVCSNLLFFRRYALQLDQVLVYGSFVFFVM